MKFPADRLKLTFLTKLTLYTLPQQKFSWLKSIVCYWKPHIIYFYVKRLSWNFKKNRRVDPHSYIEEVFSIQIHNQEGQKPSGVGFHPMLLMLKNVLFILTTTLRKNWRYFFSSKTSSALENPHILILRRSKYSLADWDQNQKVGDQYLEKCEGAV